MLMDRRDISLKEHRYFLFLFDSSLARSLGVIVGGVTSKLESHTRGIVGDGGSPRFANVKLVVKPVYQRAGSEANVSPGRLAHSIENLMLVRMIPTSLMNLSTLLGTSLSSCCTSSNC